MSNLEISEVELDPKDNIQDSSEEDWEFGDNITF